MRRSYDGSKLTAWSHYLPLNGQTYNADISRAVARPAREKKSPNKDRLGGSTFAYEPSVRQRKRSIEREWKLRGSQDRAGDALAALRARYEVIASDINPYHSEEYGTATYKGEPEQVNLHATLRKSSFPPGVSVALVLQQVQGKVGGIEGFLAQAEKYESLALSVPWLNQYMQEYPRVPIRISYVQDRSLGDKALKTFAEDMQFRDRQDLIAQVREHQDEIALLLVGNTYSETYWILFPDKHMVLWRYGGVSGLLKWSPSDFSAENAPRETSPTASGRLFTPMAPADLHARPRTCTAGSGVHGGNQR